MKGFGRLLTCLVGLAFGIGCGSTPLESWSTSGSGGIISSDIPRGTGGSSNPSSTGNGNTSAAIDGSGGTGGTIGTPGENPVAWKTSTVSLTAEDFWIVADGQRFTGRAATVAVQSDPGDSKYTTLELTWTELGREMRFYLYFKAEADAWWSNEMRTYDGQEDSGWLFYHGPFIKTPIGDPCRGDLDFKNDRSDEIRGEIHLHGLTISTTLTGG